MQSPRVRFTWLDAVLIALLLFGAGLFAWRVNVSLDYQWRWGLLWGYLLRFDEASGQWVPGLITQGLLTTVRLSLWAMILAPVFGLSMGLCRTARGLLPQMVARTYVGIVRNTPPLVLIFIFYFFLADLALAALGIDDALRAAPDWLQSLLPYVAAPLDRMPNFLAALLTMAIYEGAFITEHVRAGIESVECSQHEASYALGLSRWQSMRYVILPQALSRIVPPLAGQFISTIKDTAIVSLISVQELTFQGMELLASTSMIFETMLTMTALYLGLTLCCSLLARRVELRFRQ